jgi:hypothetical protein
VIAVLAVLALLIFAAGYARGVTAERRRKQAKGRYVHG